jgi:ring-1,2-phenylacetyl-CoA epoxidase subunit PaaD
VIPILVRVKLEEAGYKEIQVAMTITPPWSTDWISEEGNRKLLAYGISPPNGKAADQLDEGKPSNCPQCGSTHLEEISRYGSTPCKAAYRCTTCLEPFDYFKCY